MGRKRAAALVLAALMALGLSGCGAGGDKGGREEAGMTIAPVRLSEEEQRLAQLMCVDMDSCHIFEFQAAGARSLQFSTYELADGGWSRIQGGGGAALGAENGRIALTFGKITDGVRLSFQTQVQFVSYAIRPETEDDVSGMAFAMSALDGAQAIELEREIPLVLQVATSRNEVRMYQVDYFEMPRELARHGYEHVYAITVLFSAQEAGGLSQDAPPAEPSPAE